MRVVAVAAAALLCGCAATLPTAVDLRNASFEEGDPARSCPSEWDCTAHAGTESYRFFADGHRAPSGRRSFCVERVTPEPWALVRQLVRHEQLLGANLRLTVSVRVEGASGAGAGPWVLVEGPQLVNASRLVRGSEPWAPASLDFTVPRDATALVVGATLEGPGKACFDDVRLELRAGG